MTRDETYLFDVGPIALAHAATPVSEVALEYVREAIQGRMRAIIPHPAVIGAHHILRNVYRIKNETASDLMMNLLSAKSIEWFKNISESMIRRGLETAGIYNIQGWDGYYASIAKETDTDVVLTIDKDDFDTLPFVETEPVLNNEQMAELNSFLDELKGVNTGDRDMID